jgi:hypothetical protein
MPFYWVGALVSAAFLTIVMSIFGLLLKVGARAATEIRDSILPGLITGVRDWAGDGLQAIRTRSPRAEEGGSAPEETPANAALRLEHVRRAH